MPIFLDTRGHTTLGVGLCGRCSRKRSLDHLSPDVNIPGLLCCNDATGNESCLDLYDPWRLPARAPDRRRRGPPRARARRACRRCRGTARRSPRAAAGRGGEPSAAAPSASQAPRQSCVHGRLARAASELAALAPRDIAEIPLQAAAPFQQRKFVYRSNGETFTLMFISGFLVAMQYDSKTGQWENLDY